METPQGILDKLASYYVSIGALEHEKGYHLAIVKNIESKVAELREATASIQKKLMKEPEKTDVAAKPL